MDEDGEREVYVASVPSFDDWRRFAADPVWAVTVEEFDEGFALFVACDATTLSAEPIEEFASYCIERGLCWVSTWGADCERVHDIFDRVGVAEDSQPGIVMSTWHDDEPLDDALLLFWDAFPAEGEQGGAARIGISVGSSEWVEEMRKSADDLVCGGEGPETVGAVLAWDNAEVTAGRILRGPWARRAVLLLVLVLFCYLAFLAYVIWGLYATRDW